MNLRIEIRRSPRLLALALFSHLGALAIVPWLELAAGWRIALAAAVLASLALNSKRHLHRGADSVAAVQVSDDGAWSLRRANAGKDEPASLRSHFSHPAAIVLRLRSEPGGTVTVVLMPDTQDAETLRQLRVRLAALREERKR